MCVQILHLFVFAPLTQTKYATKIWVNFIFTVRINMINYDTISLRIRRRFIAVTFLNEFSIICEMWWRLQPKRAEMWPSLNSTSFSMNMPGCSFLSSRNSAEEILIRNTVANGTRDDVWEGLTNTWASLNVWHFGKLTRKCCFSLLHLLYMKSHLKFKWGKLNRESWNKTFSKGIVEIISPLTIFQFVF